MSKEKKREKRIDEQILVQHEGMMDYCQAKSPYTKEDPRSLGWNLGRQMICQHLIEVALKGELAKHQRSVPRHHDLETMYSGLPKRRRMRVEKLYRQLLESRFQETWDVFETIESSLHFMGRRPTVETRYYWEEDSRSNTLGVGYFGMFVSIENYVNIMYALMIAFHNYPTEEIAKRYDTRFKSLKGSVERGHDIKGVPVSPADR